MNEYFRITAYHPIQNFSMIIDSNGKFKKLWQFSAFLVSKGLKILEVSKEENLIDGNIQKANPNSTQLILRACNKGKPTYKQLEFHNQKIIQISNKHYTIQ